MSKPQSQSPRRGNRSGVVALLSSLVLVLWVAGLSYLATLVEASEIAAGAATVMFFVSWVVVPVLAVTALVAALIALLLNRVPGKILGALAIVIPVVATVFALEMIVGLLE